MASLKNADLEKAAPGTVIMDKFGVRYFKTADNVWMSDSLESVKVSEIVKKRVTEVQ